VRADPEKRFFGNVVARIRGRGADNSTDESRNAEVTTSRLNDVQAAGDQSNLTWLADAPLFIDEDQVARFYDAVVSPPNKEGPRTYEVTKEEAEELKKSVNAKVSTGLATAIFGNLLPSGELGGGLEKTGRRGRQQTETVTLEPIASPQRELVQLATHYVLRLRERLFLVNNPSETDWRDPVTISQVPRELVFLNLPGQEEAQRLKLPEARIIPMAAEFANGKVVRLFSELVKKIGEEPPPYPDTPVKGGESADAERERKEYWRWFDAHFSTRQAIAVIEEAASKNGRIRWVACRLPITNDGDTLHLDIVPAEKYNTGTLAYNFIRRGHRHGLRLVGTLKSEPDMNVLAIYEK